MKSILAILFISCISASTVVYGGNGDLLVDGKVGIGTAVPASSLHVVGDTGIRLESTASKYGFISSQGK